MPAQACRRGSTAVSAVGRSRSAPPFVSRPRTGSRRPSAVAVLKERAQTFDKETSVPRDDWRNDVNRSGRTRGARLHEEAGAAAVEFAIVASLFFMLVFAIIDFGFGFHTWNGTAHAAREGARLTAVDPDPAAIESRVRQAAGFLDQTKMTVTVQCSRNGGGGSSHGLRGLRRDGFGKKRKGLCGGRSGRYGW